MEVIVGYIASFLIYAMIFAIIGGWIFVWYYKIKCRKIKGCKKEKCLYREFCDHKIMTDGEREKLKKLIWECYRQKNPNLSEWE